MEREREIRAFIPESFWVITAKTNTKERSEIIFLCLEQPKTEIEANRILAIGREGTWNVVDVKEQQVKRTPKPPFITSTLQQAGSSRLGLSPSNTMRLAQRLYEAGHITYMRTDSTALSKDALRAIGMTIEKNFGKELTEFRVFKTKSKNAQEAHEAIRPTHFDKKNVGSSEQERKLYNLIWSRTVASQMKDAQTLRTTISAKVSGSETIPDFSATGSIVISPGWLLADPRARAEDVELPKVNIGDSLSLIEINSEGKQTEPPGRYTEAGLVKELEKRGIGRPSTYAAIIQTLVTRGYVTKDKRTLTPTDTGDVVSTFLENNFTNIISDKFTAEMEEELDEIARGERGYEKTLKSFYTPFKKLVKEKDKEIGKLTTLGEADQKWKCPTCGGRMVIKLGKNGRFMSCEKFPECTGARTIEGEEMKGPEETGEDCPVCKEGKLVTRQGRYGPFVSCNRYPKCKFIKEDEEAKKARDTGVLCPLCKKGTMGERRGRYGIFYGCSNYPDCKNIIKSKPTGALCPTCGSLMMEGTKTIPERCSNKTCSNHNPHKLAK
jgi:DNA topoisomerase-1